MASMVLFKHVPDDMLAHDAEEPAANRPAPHADMATDPAMVRWTGIPVPHARHMSEQFAFTIIPRGWEEATQASAA